MPPVLLAIGNILVFIVAVVRDNGTFTIGFAAVVAGFVATEEMFAGAQYRAAVAADAGMKLFAKGN